MARHGATSPFDPTQEDWTTYVERLEMYFLANEIGEAARKRAVLLSVCGPTAYRLIRNLAQPDKPSELSYDNIIKLLSDHYFPSQSVSVQRFRFNSRCRRSGETVADYVAELRRISEHCQFADSLDAMLRDRLVCGINDQRMQRRLLAEPDLTCKKAVELAQAIESADQNVRDLQKSTPSDLHAITPVEQRQTPRRASRPSSSRSPHSGVSVRRSQPPTACPRCAGQHWASDCRFRNATCHECGKTGHLRRVCRSKRTNQQPNQQKPHKQLLDTHCLSKQECDHSDSQTYNVFYTPCSRSDQLRLVVNVDGVDLPMELDTGAAVSIISHRTYRTIWPDSKRPVLHPSTARLRTYSGEIIDILGSIHVTASYHNQSKQLSLLVVPTDGPTLFGRDWLRAINLDWKQLHHMQAARQQPLQDILDKYSDLFKDEMGILKGTKVTIHIQPDARPRFFRPRPVPYALRGKVEAELQRLQNVGVIEPVQFSDWAAPIVPVLKKDGSLRICGDFKLTINHVATPDVYPLPKVEDLFATLSGGDTFTKLDLAHAYQQLLLDEHSSKLATINTTKGLFRYNRLPFGVSAAPAIFQRTMENLLQGMSHVCVYLDDVLITGHTDAEHLNNLSEVLRRMQEAGIRLK